MSKNAKRLLSAFLSLLMIFSAAAVGILGVSAENVDYTGIIALASNSKTKNAHALLDNAISITPGTFFKLEIKTAAAANVRVVFGTDVTEGATAYTVPSSTFFEAKTTGTDWETLTFSIPADNSKIDWTKVNYISVRSTKNFTLRSDFSADWTAVLSCKAAYTITLSEDESYRLIPNGSESSVPEGSTYSFVFSLNSGYSLGDDFAVMANGTVLTPDNDGVTYTFTPTENTVITVTGVKVPSHESGSYNAYLYEGKAGSIRKSGFYLDTDCPVAMAENEADYIFDAWVYISNVESYFVIMQLYGTAPKTMKDNTVEYWAYRYILSSKSNPNGTFLNAGWNHIVVPISSFKSGTSENYYTKEAFADYQQSGKIMAVSFHENENNNYGKYTFAVANACIVDSGAIQYPLISKVGTKKVEDMKPTLGDNSSEFGIMEIDSYTPPVVTPPEDKQKNEFFIDSSETVSSTAGTGTWDSERVTGNASYSHTPNKEVSTVINHIEASGTIGTECFYYLYISDLDNLKTLQWEVSSSGNYTGACIRYQIGEAKIRQTLVKGWNKISFKLVDSSNLQAGQFNYGVFSDSYGVGLGAGMTGNVDYSKINYFRFVFETKDVSKNLNLKINCLRIGSASSVVESKEYVISYFNDQENTGGNGVMDPLGKPLTTNPTGFGSPNEYCGNEWAEIIDDAGAEGGKALKIHMEPGYTSFNKTTVSIRAISEKNALTVKAAEKANTFVRFNIYFHNYNGIYMDQSAIEFSQDQDKIEYQIKFRNIPDIQADKWIECSIPFSKFSASGITGDMKLNMFRIFLAGGNKDESGDNPYVMIDNVKIVEEGSFDIKAFDTKDGIFYYYVDNGGAVISKYDALTDSDKVVIPETIEGIPVTGVSGKAFDGYDFINEYDIPSTVTPTYSGIFGKHTYWRYYGFANYMYVGGVGTVDMDSAAIALAGLNGINVRIGKDVTSLDASVVSGLNISKISVDGDNADLSSDSGILFNKEKNKILVFPNAVSGRCVIPKYVTEIGEYSFAKSRFSDLVIPETVQTIGQNAFSGCVFNRIEIPFIGGSRTENRSFGYLGCKASSVVIAEGVEEIPESAFYNCSEINEVVLPQSLKIIGEDAFGLCTGLLSVSIPAGVTEIGNYAFFGCNNLINVIIAPKSNLRNIGTYAFYECDSLASVQFQGLKSDWDKITLQTGNEALVPPVLSFVNVNKYEAERVLDMISVSKGWSSFNCGHFSKAGALKTQTGGYFKFTFTGIGFSIMSYTSASQGKLFISIDGGEEIEVNLYSEGIDTGYKQEVFANDALDYDSHIVEIRAEGKAYVDALTLAGELQENADDILKPVTYEAEECLNLTKSDEWTEKFLSGFSGQNALYTAAGGTLSFKFTGKQISVISYKSVTQGRLFVSIDGGEETEISLSEGKADTYFKSSVYTGDVLEYGDHTVNIRALGRVYIDAFEVLRKIEEYENIEAESADGMTFTSGWSDVDNKKFSGKIAKRTTDGGGVSFTYTGYDFKLISYKSPSQGTVYISVDGNNYVAVSLYYDRTDVAYITTAFSTSGLTYGNHVIDIITSGSVYLDSVKIDGEFVKR